MNHLIRKAFLCVITIATLMLSSFAMGDTFRELFENRYRAWRTWVGDHPYLSTYTTSPEFQAIVALGPPVVPFLIEKIEQNPEDFHLEVAVHRIAKKRFDKTEWPQGKRGDAKTAAEMYVQWWKVDRFKTGERFAELYGKWKSLKAEKKDKEADKTYQQIVDLGLPVLPYLLDKVEQQTKFVPAISKLSDGELDPKARVKDIKKWWKKNKQRFELPNQSAPEQTSANENK